MTNTNPCAEIDWDGPYYFLCRRDDLLQLLGEYALPETGDCAPVAMELVKRLDKMEIKRPSNWQHVYIGLPDDIRESL